MPPRHEILKGNWYPASRNFISLSYYILCRYIGRITKIFHLVRSSEGHRHPYHLLTVVLRGWRAHLVLSTTQQTPFWKEHGLWFGILTVYMGLNSPGGMSATAPLPESSHLNRQQGWLKTTPSAFPPLFASGREHKLSSDRIRKGIAAAPSTIKLERRSNKFSSLLQVFEQEKGP